MKVQVLNCLSSTHGASARSARDEHLNCPSQRKYDNAWEALTLLSR